MQQSSNIITNPQHNIPTVITTFRNPELEIIRQKEFKKVFFEE
jgi:hypothetical protein